MRAFRIAYDGRPYHGFQRQPDLPTVESALFEALCELGVVDGPDAVPPGYAAAGRTDAGVSAVAQSVAFECPEWLTPRAFNGQLPAHVRAWASADVPADFHATYDATSRAYEYHLYAPGADPDLAAEAMARLEGTHDFANLTAASVDDTVRTLQTARVEQAGDFLVFSVRADGFLWELVRRLGSLVRAVATGEAPIGKVDRVLDPAPVPGHEGVPPAAPTGLVLVDATYPGVTFESDARGVASVREVFETKRAEAATVARASGCVENWVGRTHETDVK
ncbi:tRNA pseudouridine(38-40) synthase TruA [Haloarchaeobius amylolyticus]|uniref:tRNA pseudouridine(38-40) synthase TruA n=1 Tax=Haloarchaeobius amylolyticus TaxID=1198296 RepID=UPI0022707920|nr:tRNA pseudouridine(38-40) synthase TruA [Haloarchaeobius amylolyticus]